MSTVFSVAIAFIVVARSDVSNVKDLFASIGMHYFYLIHLATCAFFHWKLPAIGRFFDRSSASFFDFVYCLSSLNIRAHIVSFNHPCAFMARDTVFDYFDRFRESRIDEMRVCTFPLSMNICDTYVLKASRESSHSRKALSSRVDLSVCPFWLECHRPYEFLAP